MNPNDCLPVSRRALLRNSAAGFGMMALAGMLAEGLPLMANAQAENLGRGAKVGNAREKL